MAHAIDESRARRRVQPMLEVVAQTERELFELLVNNDVSLPPWIDWLWRRRHARLGVRLLVLVAVVAAVIRLPGDDASPARLLMAGGAALVSVVPAWQLHRDAPWLGRKVVAFLVLFPWVFAVVATSVMVLIAIAVATTSPADAATTATAYALLSVLIAMLAFMAKQMLNDVPSGRTSSRRSHRVHACVGLHLIGVVGLNAFVLFVASLALQAAAPDDAGRLMVPVSLATLAVLVAAVRGCLHRKRKVRTQALEAIDAAVVQLVQRPPRRADDRLAQAFLDLERALGTGVDLGLASFRAPLETRAYRHILLAYASVVVPLPLRLIPSATLKARRPDQRRAVERALLDELVVLRRRLAPEVDTVL